MTTPYLAEQSPQPIFDVSQLFSFLWQNKFRIVITALIIAGLGSSQIMRMQKMYRASSTILLDTNTQNFSLPDPVSSFTAGGDSQLETYIEYMHSRIFLEKIVRELKLTQLEEFRSKTAKATEQRHVDYAVSLLLYNLSISRLGETHLLKISYESLTPTVAAEIANYVGPAFFAFLDQMNKKRADEALAWLTNHIADLQEELSSAEEAYQSFLRENQMIDTASQINIANREISNLINRRGDNKKKIADFERTLEQIEAADNDVELLMSIPRFLNMPLLIENANKTAEQRRVLAQLEKRYKSKHPKHIAAKSTLDQLIIQQMESIQQFIGAIKQDYATLKLNRDTLNKQIEDARNELSELAADELKINKLKRDVVATQKVYDAFLSRLQETEILRELGQNEQYAVVDIASVPTSPSKPRIKLLLAVTVLMSVFLSVGFWLAIHIINDKVSRYRNLLHKLAIPVMAEIPRTSGRIVSNTTLATVKQSQQDYSFSEAIRSLRTSLIVGDQDTRIVLITSIRKGDGKTTLATSLAQAFGKQDTTLLVDADMRYPSLQPMYNLLQDHPGLSDFITRRSGFKECIHKVSESQLTIMPSGTTEKDPLIHFSKNRFAVFVERLEVFYDRVIIMAPPISDFSDALVLAKHAHSSVIVCDVEQSDSDDIVDAVQRIRDAGAKTVGVAINKSKSMRAQIKKQSAIKRASKWLFNLVSFRRK